MTRILATALLALLLGSAPADAGCGLLGRILHPHGHRAAVKLKIRSSACAMPGPSLQGYGVAVPMPSTQSPARNGVACAAGLTAACR